MLIIVLFLAEAKLDPNDPRNADLLYLVKVLHVVIHHSPVVRCTLLLEDTRW